MNLWARLQMMSLMKESLLGKKMASKLPVIQVNLWMAKLLEAVQLFTKMEVLIMVK